MSSQFDYLLKYIIIGDSSVGKSNIISVYRDGTFNEKKQPSIGVEFIAKNIRINDTSEFIIRIAVVFLLYMILPRKKLLIMWNFGLMK